MAKRGVKRSSSDNEYGRRRRQSTRLNKSKVDRLSSLPDPLLTDILSRLPINSAVATSVLSHRWRHLWTGVTRFVFNFNHFEEYKSKKLVAIVIDILAKLTSPILRVFSLDSPELLEECEPDVVESWFHQVCCRHVQHFILESDIYNESYTLFRVPITCLFEAARSLVTLKLSYMLTFDTNVDTTRFEFRCLKKLQLQCLFNFPPYLGTLIKSSPLLEDLNLMFDLFLDDSLHNAHSCLNIVAPKLKFLVITMHSPDTRRIKIFIDAPNLIDIEVHDCNSCYYFVQTPTRLTKACIDLSSESNYKEGLDEPGDDHVHQLVKFVSGLPSVHTLALHLEHRTNLFTHSANHGLNLPVFSNLASLTTSLNNIGLVGCKDFLSSLHFIPNLKHLQVNMDNKTPMERMVWSAPDCAPKCLISKLKTIKISGLLGIKSELQLLAYILSNATMLKHLEVYVRYNCGKSSQARLWNACDFCWSLFQCPRGSTACNISFFGGSVQASSDDFNGKLTCTIYHLG